MDAQTSLSKHYRTLRIGPHSEHLPFASATLRTQSGTGGMSRREQPGSLIPKQVYNCLELQHRVTPGLWLLATGFSCVLYTIVILGGFELLSTHALFFEKTLFCHPNPIASISCVVGQHKRAWSPGHDQARSALPHKPWHLLQPSPQHLSLSPLHPSVDHQHWPQTGLCLL